MKNIIVSLSVGVAILAASFSASAQNSAILNLPGASQNAGYENPVVISKSAPAGIPTTVAIGTFASFTNFNFRIVRNSDVTVSILFGSTVTNATPSNVLAFIDLSSDGRLWATNSAMTLSLAPATSSTLLKMWTIPSSNFGANAWARLRGITNAGTTGNGSVFPSNVTVSTWPPSINFR